MRHLQNRLRFSLRRLLSTALLLSAASGAVLAQKAPVQTPPATPAALQVATPQQLSPRAQQIVAQAQASYNSGVNNYRGGHLDAARLDFDFAVDTMLTSGLDLKQEGPLADQFERLIDAINSLELAALKQGNGFSPKLEEAPLEDVADTTFAPNPELVAKLKTELNVQSDLPLIINDEVAGYIGVFASSNTWRAHMAASLRRVGKYRALIEQTLKEEGVPQDLIYLAVAESGFQPQIVNRKSGAGGMWQFMPRDGVQYGLLRNGYFDYRFDPEKSSRAYARYIKRLYGMFGDWNLAMAAYDWGPGSVQRALERTGAHDYWELYRMGAMPGETRAYVPQILAAVLMAKNPEVYGLNKLVPSAAVLYDTVSTTYSIDLHLVADVTGSTVEELVALNPAMLRLVTPRDTSYDLHLPPGTKDLYTDRLKDIPEDRRATWRFHVVKPGDTLETIASALHAHSADIAASNGITDKDPMSVDDELVVPVQSVAAASRPQRYKVQRGDTLLSVADRFNVSPQDLRGWNALSASGLRPGRSIYVAEPSRVRYTAHARGRRGRAGRASRGGRSSRASSARGGSSRGSSAAAARSSSRSSRGAARSTRTRASAPTRSGRRHSR